MKPQFCLLVKYITILIFLTFTACNRVKDLQPIDTEKIPEAVVQLLTDKYPNAREVAFTNIEKDYLWEAKYTSDGLLYYAALNTNRILVVYKSVNPVVEDSLKQTFLTLKPKGGIFSDFREVVDYGTQNGSAGNKYYIADYLLNGTKYVASWNIYPEVYSGQHIYRIAMEPYYRFQYISYNPDWKRDVTDSIAAYIDKKRLSVSTLSISVGEDNNRSYEFIARDSLGTQGNITFNGNVLLHTSLTRENSMYRKLEDCPLWLREYVKNSSDFNDFGNTLLFNKYADSDLTSYYLVLSRIIFQNNSEGYSMYFNQNEKMTRLWYYGYIYF